MIYILETQLDNNKSIFFTLKNIYGIGKHTSFKICKKLGFVRNLKTIFLTENQLSKLISIIKKLNLKINDDLRQYKVLNLKHLISIKSYRGLQN